MKKNIINFNVNADYFDYINEDDYNIISYYEDYSFGKNDILFIDLDFKDNYKEILSKTNNVIGIISRGRTRMATRLLKNGLSDYLFKSDNIKKELVSFVNNFFNKDYDKDNYDNSNLYSEIFNSNAKLKVIFNNLMKLANTNIPILINGEAGCDHELYARSIHNVSNRKNSIFSEIFCSTLTFYNFEEIILKKAELSRNGTLFFENIDIMDKKIQNVFTRFIEDVSKNYNIRIISSSVKDLRMEILNGAFKEELYFLFAGSTINIPALRNIRNMIPFLVKNLYKYYATENNKNIKGITSGALKILENYDWPGNIKEIKNVINKAVILTNKDILDENDFSFLKDININKKEYIINIMDSLGNFKTMEVLENEIINRYLKINNGNITEVSKLLNVGRATIYRKLENENN